MTLNNFGERIKALRTQHKLSQTAMGKLLGVHYIHIGRYESGKAVPSIGILLAIADVFDVDLEWLVRGDQAKKHLADDELLYLFKALLPLHPDARIEIKSIIRDFLAEHPSSPGEIRLVTK